MCGIFGVSGHPEAASVVHLGLYSLQHRGQESAGIVSVDTEHGARALRTMGLVSEGFDESELQRMPGRIGIGHTRFSTAGTSTIENAQPVLARFRGGHIALAHNGNLTNTRHLMELVREQSGQDLSGEAGRGSSTDTAVITALLAGAPGAATKSLEQTAMEVLPQLEGAFSLVFMDEHSLYAARDRHGFRPLVLGSLDGGHVVASETCALDIIGAEFVREVEPPETLRQAIDKWTASEPRGEFTLVLAPGEPESVTLDAGVEMARNGTSPASI